MSAGSLPRGGRRPRAPHPVVAAGIVIICVQLAFRGWAVWGAWFQFDDFVFLSRVLNHPWSWSLVGQGYGGHLMPGGFTLTWLFARFDPLGFHWYSATLLVLEALADFGALALLASLFGRRWGILVPLSLYLFSPLTMPAFIWWAAGANQLFLQLALVWGLLAHLRYLRTGQLRWVSATVAVMVVCLAFYEKTLLAYAAFAWLTFAYFSTGSGTARIAQVWAQRRAAVAVHAACAVGYLALYLGVVGVSQTGSRGRVPLLPLVGNLVARSWVPGAFGGPLSWTVLSGPFQVVDPFEAFAVAAFAAAIVVVSAISATYARSRRAWTLPLMFAAADLVLLLGTRADLVGSVVGLEFRYVTELGLLTPLALGLACLPVRGSTETVARIRPHRYLDDRQMVAAATVVVCVLGTWSAYGYAEHWRGSDQARAYFHNADATLGTAAAPTALANISVPQYLMWGYDYPRNTTRYVLGMYRRRVTYPDVSVDHLYVIGDDGRVAPAQIAPLITGVRHRPGCMSRLGRVRSGELDLSREMSGRGAWARLSYGARRPVEVEIRAGSQIRTVELPSGLRNLFFTVSGHFDRIRLTEVGGAGSPVCVDDLAIGFPVATPTAGGGTVP